MLPTLYVRREPTRDPGVRSRGTIVQRFDTVGYADRKCTMPRARWPWHVRPPSRTQPTIFAGSRTWRQVRVAYLSYTYADARAVS